MLPRLANAFLAAVALLMPNGGKSIAADGLPPAPALIGLPPAPALIGLPPAPVLIGLPPAPTVIGFPKPSRLRPGTLARRPDGTLRYSPATVRVEKLLPPLAVAPPPISAPSEGSSAPGSRRAFESLARELAPRYGLDPELVVAVIAAESGFRSDAVSPRGATGLMQLMPQTARRFGVRNSYHPVQNLRGGMSYLRWLLSYFRGDVRLALAAYNAGERAVERHLGVPPYAETRDYVRRVMREYQRATHPFDPGLTTASPIIARLRTGN